MNNNKLLYFDGNTEIYWHGALMGLAVLAGGIIFWIFARRIRKGAAAPLKYILLFGFPFAIALSRLEYCWFRQDEFRGGLPDILNVSPGGFGLIGAMIAMCAVIFAVGRKDRRFSAAELFDAAAPAAAAAICIGRIASSFSGEERGFELYTDFFRRILFTVFDAEENKTFVLVYPYEAIAAAVLFVVTVCSFNAIYRDRKYLPGMAAVRFLLGFTLTQILFESWRSDSLFLVYLGFVRFNQAFCALVLAVTLVVLCVKYTKKFGYRSAQIGAWAVLLLGIVLAFLCEFFMTGGNHLQNYCGMIVGLAAVYITARIIIDRVFRINLRAVRQ